MLLATSGKNGRCDVAPKGDPAGFVRVLDEKHLVIPDRPGNKRFDGLRNILENPHIGLIFLVPGRQETLRINGRAWITRDEELLDTMLVEGKRPWFALGVEVEECFLHCAKALVRSHLWETASWPDLTTVPTGAELLRACPKIDQPLEEIAATRRVGASDRGNPAVSVPSGSAGSLKPLLEHLGLHQAANELAEWLDRAAAQELSYADFVQVIGRATLLRRPTRRYCTSTMPSPRGRAGVRRG
jgi:uncharacterized protein